MPPSASEINSFLASDAFSADLVPTFEEYIAAQVSGQIPYHADAVRRLVKLYQLFPSTSKADNVAQCLLLAMLQFPNPTDFLSLKYIIPNSTMNQEPCSSIKTCFEELEACRFARFWEYLETLKSENSDSIANFLTEKVHQQLQGAILQVLSFTYKEAPANSVVLPALNVKSLDAVKALHHPSVESVTSDAVVFQSTPDNTKRQRKYQESLHFDAVCALMSKISQ